MDAILAAGGLTSQADACKVVLARPTPPPSCRVALPICYREITQLGDTTTNYQLQPGDRIFVASRSFCDDLKFWQATQTCDRCCGCQHPCPDPSVANFRNPISSVLPAPPVVPEAFAEDSEADQGQGQAAEPDFVEEPSDDRLPGPTVRRTWPPAESPREPQINQRLGELEFEEPLPRVNNGQ